VRCGARRAASGFVAGPELEEGWLEIFSSVVAVPCPTRPTGEVEVVGTGGTEEGRRRGRKRKGGNEREKR
jgi:hypothetical protein